MRNRVYQYCEELDCASTTVIYRLAYSRTRTDDERSITSDTECIEGDWRQYRRTFYLHDFPLPKTCMEIRSFSKILNHYSRSIENDDLYASILYEPREVDFHARRNQLSLSKQMHVQVILKSCLENFVCDGAGPGLSNLWKWLIPSWCVMWKIYSPARTHAIHLGDKQGCVYYTEELQRIFALPVVQSLKVTKGYKSTSKMKVRV